MSYLAQAAFANENEHTRFQLEGARPGYYVRIVLQGMPCEFVTNFDLRFPLVIGGKGL